MMLKVIASIILLLLIEPFSFAWQETASRHQLLVFTHVNVIDATGAPLRPDMTVVIRQGQILLVGPSKQVAVPKTAEVIDATGKFLIPGLWDMHAHVGTDEFDKQGHLSLFVVNGVTGIRIMDGDPAHHQWRDEVDADRLTGPRMVIASPILGQSPLSATEAREAVRQAKAGHADFIKVHDGLSRDAYFAVIDEAGKVRLPVAGHVPLAVTATEAATAGQKSIEHSTGLDQAKVNTKSALALAVTLRQYHTWLCPTLIMRLSYASLDDPKLPQDPRLKYVKPSWVRRWLRMSTDAAKTSATEWANRRALVQKEKALVGLMKNAGIGILAGTDEANPFCAPGFSLHDELQLLVEAGLTPMQALQSATLSPARFFDRTRTMGTIEKGKVADLVLLDANPLLDIGNTKKINAVVRNGRLLNRQTLDRMLSEIESAARALQ